jgi:hypothetical protein
MVNHSLSLGVFVLVAYEPQSSELLMTSTSEVYGDYESMTSFSQKIPFNIDYHCMTDYG